MRKSLLFIVITLQTAVFFSCKKENTLPVQKKADTLSTQKNVDTSSTKNPSTSKTNIFDEISGKFYSKDKEIILKNNYDIVDFILFTKRFSADTAINTYSYFEEYDLSLMKNYAGDSIWINNMGSSSNVIAKTWEDCSGHNRYTFFGGNGQPPVPSNYLSLRLDLGDYTKQILQIEKLNNNIDSIRIITLLVYHNAGVISNDRDTTTYYYHKSFPVPFNKNLIDTLKF